MIQNDQPAKENTNKIEQLTLLFANYGRAIYTGQILEQKSIDMIAMDEIVTSKPESESDYDAIWSKYDISKKMMGVMTSLLQDAYHINDADIDELKSLMSVKSDLVNRYFRFNNLNTATDEDCNQIIADFVDFINRVQQMNSNLEIYRQAYNRTNGVTEKQVTLAIASKKENWLNA